MSRNVLGIGGAATVWILFASVCLGQTASFTGTGRLDTNRPVWAYGVSPGGSYIVGDAVDANGNTQAFIWSATEGIRGIGFPYVAKQESHARDVAVSSTGEIKICGWGKDAGNNDLAFLWTGNASGVGTFTWIPRLEGGNSNKAYSLVIQPGTNPENVFVTGESSSTTAESQGFRYRSDQNSTLALGLGPKNKYSIGYGMAFTDTTEIAGVVRSGWSDGGDAREASVWKSSSWEGDFGLTRICGGEGWQIVAGPNGVADTQAQGSNLQITPVGTSGLDPDTVVVSAGPMNIIKDITHEQGDDIVVPAGLSPTGGESIYRGISPNGRYQVGDSIYPDAPSGYRMAFLHDVKNRDYSTPDNCGGFGFSWPLGFLTMNNDGTPAEDNYSQANGVSNGSAAPGRNGLVVVGYSYYDAGDTGDSPREAFICLIQSGPDIWFLRQQGADPTDNGAPVATQFKDMRNLQRLLAHDFGLDLTGWDLREATAVSNDGVTLSGYGLHNGVEEGFVAVIPGLPSQGACCNHQTLECSITFPGECDGEFLGPDTVCTRCCPKPFSDGDTDGDVDMDDFALFQACINANVPSVILPGCDCWDADANGTIDEADFERGFTICGSGPGIAADPDCQ